MAVVPVELFSPAVVEMFQLLDPLLVLGVFDRLLKDLHLVEGSLQVVGGTFLDFYCHIGVKFGISAKPDS